MKNNLTVTMFVLVLGFNSIPATSQVAQPRNDASVIKKDLLPIEVSSLRKPIDIQLGTLPPNTTSRFQLPFKNLLGREFNPSEVVLSCKCLNVNLDDKPIRNGDTANFILLVRSGVHTNAPFNQEVRIFDKDAIIAPIVLRLSGMVRIPINIANREIPIERSEKALIREIEFTSTDPSTDLSGVNVSTRHPGINAKVLRLSKQFFVLQLSIDENEAFQLRTKQEFDVLLGNIYVNGKAEIQNETFAISFTERVVFSPGKLLVYDDGKTATGRITLRGVFDNKTEVTVASTAFSSEITHRKDGEITLTITSDHHEVPPKNIELIVKPGNIMTTIPVEVLSRK